MKSESQRYLALLERRLSLLEALSKTLAAWRADFVSMDLSALGARIQEQESLCAEIGSLDGRITATQVRCAALAGVAAHPSEICWPDGGSGDPGLSERIGATLQRLAAAQAELKRLNDAHQAMLRRTRHTVGVLLNLFHSYAPSYAPLPAPQTGRLCEERV